MVRACTAHDAVRTHARLGVYLSFVFRRKRDVLLSVHVVFFHPRRQPRLRTSFSSSHEFPVHFGAEAEGFPHLDHPPRLPLVSAAFHCQVHQGRYVPLPLHKARVRGEQEGTGVDARGNRQLLGDDQQERSPRSHWPKQLARAKGLGFARPDVRLPAWDHP